MRWLLAALLGLSSGRACTHRPAAELAPSTARIRHETVIGLTPGREDPLAALQLVVPNRRSALVGTRLHVLWPEGEPVEDPEVVRRIADELRRYAGGWFADVAPFVKLFRSLESPELRARYASLHITWDVTSSAFYAAAFRVPPWNVELVGEPGVFHTIFLWRPLPEDAADRLPRYRLFGDVRAILDVAAPNLPPLVDRSREHVQNVFDWFLTADHVMVRAGARAIFEAAPGPPRRATCFYGIRVNIDLR